ncbi:hypothetical protein [Klebsiella oxytoca]|uniref:hypothetical protein n=1 Tax=Klebsiella oxytoca TaxID=571 RepID=UPI000F84CA19|nr:hypothetical protein [Klebsiella oxytoca]HEC2024460.1 hypothetical protein [Klebsiella oxytoca]
MRSIASGEFNDSALYWATLRAAPGAALNAPCPGYGFTAVCGPEARAKRRQAADTTDFCSSQSRNTCK